FAEAPRHSRVLRVQAALRERGACLFEDPSASRYFVPASALPSPKGLVSIGPTGNSRAGGVGGDAVRCQFLKSATTGRTHVFRQHVVGRSFPYAEEAAEERGR